MLMVVLIPTENLYSAVGNKALTYVKTAKTANDLAKSVLENGFKVTGMGIAKELLKEYVIKEVKRNFNNIESKTDPVLSYLQCFNIKKDYNSRLDFNIGDTNVISIRENMSVEINDTGLRTLGTIISNLYLYSKGTDVGLEKQFTDCAIRKVMALEEDTTLDRNNGFSAGAVVLMNRFMFDDTYSALTTMKNDIAINKFEKYLNILKLSSFNKSEMENYSNHLKAVAATNTATILQDIMIEREFIKSKGSIKHPFSVPLFTDVAVKHHAIIKYKAYYKPKSISRAISRSVSSESVETIKVVNPNDFLSLGLSISDAHIDDIVIDKISIEAKTLPLERKAMEGVSATYYKATSDSFETNTYTRKSLVKDDFVYDETKEKYTLTFQDLFSSLSISEPSLFEATLMLQVTYKGKPYLLSKEYSFIADSDDSYSIKPVKRGSFEFTVRSDSDELLEDAEVSVGGKACTTGKTGKCTIVDLVPAEYTASIRKDGYLPTFMDTFIDKAGTKELSFTLKKVETVEGETYLDVVAVRSEVNPLQFSFYVTAAGEDLELTINYGDDTNDSGVPSLLTNKDGFIPHTYTSPGVYEVTVTLASASGDTKTQILKIYPITNDSVVDVVFLVDLSGSYGSSLDNFKSKAKDIAQAFSTLGSDVRVGLTSFVDFPIYPFGDEYTGDYAFSLDSNLTYNIEEFNSKLQSLALYDGKDTPESQIEGLYQTAKQINWSDGSKKYIFIATDASFHNSDTEDSYPGKGYEETLTLLKSKNIVVMGLNRDAELEDVTKVTIDTGGEVFMLDGSSSDIAEKILNYTLKSAIEYRSINRSQQHTVGSTIRGNAN